MNLENFPMDVQRCPLKLGSCESNKFVNKLFAYNFTSPTNLVGYTTADVLYRWNSRTVAISDDLKMSQFDLIDVPSSNESIRIGSESVGKTVGELNQHHDNDTINKKKVFSALQEYSVLLVSFHLQRHMGNFLIQVYGPCICKVQNLTDEHYS